MAHRTKNRQRGAGYIEVLVSSLILAISLLAALSLYGFSMGLIHKTGDEGVAYNIARHTLEKIRQNGFDPRDSSGAHVMPDGTTTVYYDAFGTEPPSSTLQQNSLFKLVWSVTSDKKVVGTSLPAPDALRTVLITVYYANTNEQVEQTGTFLVRSGL